MGDVVIGILAFAFIPLIFFAVGVFLIVKGIQGLKNGALGTKKVYARCIQIEEVTEPDGITKLYRPVFQYEDQGFMQIASGIDYEYEKSAEVGDCRTITVEKKHPDVITEPQEQGASARAIVLIVMGVIFAASILEIGIPLLFVLLMSL